MSGLFGSGLFGSGLFGSGLFGSGLFGSGLFGSEQPSQFISGLIGPELVHSFPPIPAQDLDKFLILTSEGHFKPIGLHESHASFTFLYPEGLHV